MSCLLNALPQIPNIKIAKKPPAGKVKSFSSGARMQMIRSGIGVRAKAPGF
jgi:hypothetical protein